MQPFDVNGIENIFFSFKKVNRKWYGRQFKKKRQMEMMMSAFIISMLKPSQNLGMTKIRRHKHLNHTFTQSH